MNWFDWEYPDTWYIVEVKYNGGVVYTNGNTGDIAIATVRAKRGEEPKKKDNQYGFTANFLNENDARRFAILIAAELYIPTCIKEKPEEWKYL